MRPLAAVALVTLAACPSHSLPPQNLAFPWPIGDGYVALSRMPAERAHELWPIDGGEVLVQLVGLDFAKGHTLRLELLDARDDAVLVADDVYLPDGPARLAVTFDITQESAGGSVTGVSVLREAGAGLQRLSRRVIPENLRPTWTGPYSGAESGIRKRSSETVYDIRPEPPSFLSSEPPSFALGWWSWNGGGTDTVACCQHHTYAGFYELAGIDRSIIGERGLPDWPRPVWLLRATLVD